MSLVCLDDREACWRAASAIERMGCRVEVLSVDAWVHNHGCLQDAGLSAAFFGRAPAQGLVSVVRAQAPALSLGIFADPAVMQQVRATEWFAESLAWPCSDGELRACLGRLGQLKATDCASVAVESDGLVEEFSRFNLVGRGAAFLAALARIKRIAACEAPVVIEGETGTGKELAARAIHYLGVRRGEAFVPVNCGALQDALMESQLFGHRRGAFTGASDTHAGLVSQADGGTLFLDEIEALTAKGQVSLLRFLQDQRFQVVGGTTLQSADVRIVAASNQRLPLLVEQGLFRADLFYRLAVMTVSMPALRERPEDIPLLARHFFERYRCRYAEAPRVLRADLLARMQAQVWSGNVRELENFIHRVCCFAEGVSSHQADDALGAGEAGCGLASFSEEKARAISEFERRYLTEVMQATDGNVTAAARRAGKERRAFGKLLKKYRLDRARFTD